MNLISDWDNFIEDIDFDKINKIKKNIEDENLTEGMRVRKFLKKYMENVIPILKGVKKYSSKCNQAPTQQYFSEDNGLRCGLYYGNHTYNDSTQLNITIGANWGGGIFIKDNENLIFGNKKLLEYLKNKYKTFMFGNSESRHIFAIRFKNNILPGGKETLEAIQHLNNILEVTIRENDMQEKINLLKNRKQIILQGPPGTGKTRMSKLIARNIIKNSIVEEAPKINDLSEQVKLIQFHPSYSYEDFVRGIVAESDGENIKYKTKNKVLVDMANKAYTALENDGYYKTDDKEEKEMILKKSDKYILIIDEINRANLSSVLGELIYALEYRDEAVESMYALEDGSRNITLPSNLYIIGTMNTADRSIGHIDYAIRRRFAFENILADKEEATDKVKFQEVKDIFEHISPEFEEKRVMLGHSYFIGDEKELEEKLKYQVVPLLREYVSDGVLTSDATTKIDDLLL